MVQIACSKSNAKGVVIKKFRIRLSLGWWGFAIIARDNDDFVNCSFGCSGTRHCPMEWFHLGCLESVGRR